MLFFDRWSSTRAHRWSPCSRLSWLCTSPRRASRAFHGAKAARYRRRQTCGTRIRAGQAARGSCIRIATEPAHHARVERHRASTAAARAGTTSGGGLALSADLGEAGEPRVAPRRLSCPERDARPRANGLDGHGGRGRPSKAKKRKSDARDGRLIKVPDVIRLLHRGGKRVSCSEADIRRLL